MSNRIEKLFAEKASAHKLLSPYITAGDPEPGITVELMHQLVKAGADIIELGIPFSDPMAEGPVIQAAMERALRHGIGCDDVLAMVSDFRKDDVSTPIILMGYCNPIEMMGYEVFAAKAKQAGVDGIIIVDLPPEESEAVIEVWRQQQLHMIYLCSPTTTVERMQLIENRGSGYLYYVSLKGVTGANSIDIDDVKQHYLQRKQQTDLPLLVGFGIKTPEAAATIASFADGVIVGAALIQQIAALADSPKQIPQQVPKLIKAMREAMNLKTR